MSNIESTVCFFKDLYKVLAVIPPEDAGLLMRALFADANGIEPDFGGSEVAKGLFIMAADQMHRLEDFRRSKTRSKTEQTAANESKTPHSSTPYPYPYPNPNNNKPKRLDFEQRNTNYNEILNTVGL